MKNDTRSIEEILHRPKASLAPADLELVLREHFADRLPWVSWGGERVELSRLLVNDKKGRFHGMLSAIDAAYDRDNVLAQTSMRGAIRDLVNQPFDATKWTDPLWGSLTTWGDRHIGDKIWQSKTDQGTSFIVGLFLKPDAEICARLDNFRRMGVDLDEPIDNDFGGASMRFSALSYAVATRSTSAVGQLLGYDCDPERMVRMQDDKPLSAMSLADKNAAKVDQDPEKLELSVQIHHICGMLRSSIAKRHALSVIEEMDADVQKARP